MRNRRCADWPASAASERAQVEDRLHTDWARPGIASSSGARGTRASATWIDESSGRRSAAERGELRVAADRLLQADDHLGQEPRPQQEQGEVAAGGAPIVVVLG